MRERRLNRSDVRTEALAMQFDQVAMEGGFDLIVLTGQSGDTIATGSVMDREGATVLSAFGASALRLLPQLNSILPDKNRSEVSIGRSGGFKIYLRFFEFNGQKLVVAARAFKPYCDPAMLKRLCSGAKRILEARDIIKR